MSRRTAVPALALALAAVLAGCAGLPTSGPVGSAGPVGVDPPVVRACPGGPAVGASPAEVVRGFLRAAGCFDEEHAVARLFLTPQRAAQWRPDASVVVYPTTSRLRITGTGEAPDGADPGPDATSARVGVVTPVEARVSAVGAYTEATAGEVAEVELGLVRQDGEWRIADIPDGLLLPASDFARVFAPFPVWFADGDRRELVPDVRWFPQLQPLPSALVRTLLRGPVEWLEPAVVTGAPGGTSLVAGAVPVVDGVAVVDLGAQVLEADDSERVLLLAQLQRTLRQLPQVREVAVQVRGAPFEVRGVRSRPVGDLRVQADVSARFTSRGDEEAPVVLVEDEGDGVGGPAVARLEVRELVEVPRTAGLERPGLELPGVDTAGQVYAVLADGRTRLLAAGPGGEVVELLTGQELTAPSLDDRGWVWSTSAASSGAVTAARADGGEVVEVEAPWLAARRVLSLRVSPDGARAAVVTEIAEGSPAGRAVVEVAAVTREDGRPLALGEPLRLAPGLVSARTATWSSLDELLVLGAADEGEQRAWTVLVGGPLDAVEGEPLPEARVLTGGGDTGVLAGTADDVLARAGLTWVRLDLGARDPAHPG